jgi:formylglycine-generating enzyme
VTISSAFYMGILEVSKAQFAQFIAASRYKTQAEENGKSVGWDGRALREIAGISWRKTGFSQGDDHPVVNVSWYDALEFCKWLGKKTGRTTRLPTEAEWEYACRAGTKTAYPWGDAPDDGKGLANAADQAARKALGPDWQVFTWDDGYQFTSPGGRFKANAFGVHDMIGNVWEWCSDWYDEKYYATASKTDPQGPSSGTARVLRGGSWDSMKQCRSAYRHKWKPDGSECKVGFRVVLEPQWVPAVH